MLSWKKSTRQRCRAGSIGPAGSLYRTAPGVGPLTAATLVAFLPELGQWGKLGADLTSLVGLASWSRDSGRKRGHTAMRGGRGVVQICTSVPAP